mgnify:CR=1 FL=1
MQQALLEIVLDLNNSNSIYTENTVMQQGGVALPFKMQGWENSRILVNVYNPGAKNDFLVRVKVPNL